jgi:predicted dehydrogenase
VTLDRARAATSGALKLGVIGAGNFAKSVLLPRLAKNNEVSLTAIATATGRNAKATAEQYGFNLCATDHRELLGRPEIDAVLIATRHDAHSAMTAEALRAGKTVYVEKPLAITREGLDEVVKAVAETGGRVMVGFNRRFSPLSMALKEAFAGVGPLAIGYRVNAGEIPRESWIQGAEGGGRILGEVCHFVDYLQFLTGADPIEVFAGSSADGPDTLSVVIKLSDGSVGNINYFATGDRALAKERIEVYGGGRAGVLDDFRTLEIYRQGRRKTIKRMAQDKGFDEELRAFVAAARSGGEMPISWRSLVLTTAATLAIVDSLASGQPEPVKSAE